MPEQVKAVKQQLARCKADKSALIHSASEGRDVKWNWTRQISRYKLLHTSVILFDSQYSQCGNKKFNLVQILHKSHRCSPSVPNALCNVSFDC